MNGTGKLLNKGCFPTSSPDQIEHKDIPSALGGKENRLFVVPVGEVPLRDRFAELFGILPYEKFAIADVAQPAPRQVAKAAHVMGAAQIDDEDSRVPVGAQFCHGRSR